MGGAYYSGSKNFNNNQHFDRNQAGPDSNSPSHHQLGRMSTGNSGTVNFPNGSVFNGERRNGKKHGQGV